MEKPKGVLDYITLAADKALHSATDAVLNKLMADYDATDISFAIEKKLSLLKLLEMSLLDFQDNGRQWKPENKRRYKNFMSALKFARKFGSKAPRLIENTVTEENTILWLKGNRPDLLEVVDTPEGRIWLEDALAEIRLLLEGRVEINPVLLEGVD